jgi:hypothetical protein
MQAAPTRQAREEYKLLRLFTKQAWNQTKDSKIRIQNKSNRSGGHDSASDHNERCSTHAWSAAGRTLQQAERGLHADGHTEDFCAFPQPRQENAWIVSRSGDDRFQFIGHPIT